MTHRSRRAKVTVVSAVMVGRPDFVVFLSGRAASALYMVGGAGASIRVIFSVEADSTGGVEGRVGSVVVVVFTSFAHITILEVVMFGGIDAIVREEFTNRAA